MTYFTSDLHLGHRGIIGMQNRPFETVQEMNRILNWKYNDVVHKNDTVYLLGDISHHLSMDRANELISKWSVFYIDALSNVVMAEEKQREYSVAWSYTCT